MKEERKKDGVVNTKSNLCAKAAKTCVEAGVRNINQHSSKD
jgi:hypothetical protein